VTTPGGGAALLRKAAERLAAAGVEGATRDARWLLAHVLGVDRGGLAATLEVPLSAPQEAAFEAAVAARAARQPVAQIIGWREFWGRRFRVTPDVLDPRGDTETLVALALKAPFTTVLDLGTGSGAILLTLLAERPSARGTGTDVSEPALAVARANAEALRVADRAALRLSDWFAGVTGRFDLIVSNPPYIALGEMAGLAPEVRDWEPRLALTDGGDGLAAYRAIAAGAAAHLAPGGRLLVETGAGQGSAVRELFEAAGLEDVACHTDLGGLQRVVSARLSA
jgi:release factor glutamine methyltransferase